MAIEESLGNLVSFLPGDLVSRLEFLIIFIQAIGGIFVVYVIFTIARFFIAKKEKKIIEEIREDVKFIKKSLKKKK